MNFTKISAKPAKAQDVIAALDNANIAYCAIDCVNWPESYPYAPKVEFRLSCNDEAFLLHFKVKESAVRARYTEDNDAVWTDSCVEFFVQFDGDSQYYNVESNCIGTVKLAVGPDRHERVNAPDQAMKLIKRWSSLGTEAFETREGECEWEYAMILPFAAFFKHQITDIQAIKCNLYKCGDELPTVHFLSWAAIDTPNPDFHRPEFFREVRFL